MRTVETHLAYVWDCDECGIENFVRSITTTLDRNDPEDVAKVKRGLNLDEDDDLDDVWAALQTSPKTVTCKGCKTTFRTKDSADSSDAVEDWEHEDD